VPGARSRYSFVAEGKRTLPDVELRRMFIAICNELQAIGARWGDRGRTCHGSASPMDSPR